MSESFAVSGAVQSHHSRRRFTVRRAATLRPFVWYGLLPLLGLIGLMLAALLPFASRSIEATVRSEVRAALDQAGHAWAKLEVDGQDVVLSGTPPDAGAGERALAVARERTCPTWLGPKVCAVVARGTFDAPGPAARVTPPPAADPPKPPAPAVLAVAATPAPVAQAAAKACEKELGALLAQAQIRFAVARATIEPQSKPLLDRLAAAARNCPSTVEIEGHTDNVGSDEMNRRLSQARAEAVRAALVERGIPAERLNAVGHGPDRPAADNTSAQGRAANRRIEFRALADR